ncbi:hypothetical protein PNOK_0277700 [Pyrrhoderma noxium]|uniref:Uncharacterized protein n=1 Tax=Pyrrhoderma noxium TaxID=2282107 RepID=A0A286UT99_9AGAM|nr:hypothetical protein PNOK_0277700 [Pyrrhoderma noxium]
MKKCGRQARDSGEDGYESPRPLTQTYDLNTYNSFVFDSRTRLVFIAFHCRTAALHPRHNRSYPPLRISIRSCPQAQPH